MKALALVSLLLNDDVPWDMKQDTNLDKIINTNTEYQGSYEDDALDYEGDQSPLDPTAPYLDPTFAIVVHEWKWNCNQIANVRKYADIPFTQPSAATAQF
ncbi:hypothetical protein HDU76_003449, partial [Blyttiomyces sp. JEL0837]